MDTPTLQPLHPNAKNLVGKQFGKLIVLSLAGRGKRSEMRWNCLCECGGELAVRGSSLTSGNTSSCGCCGALKRTHGLSGTPTYRAWVQMHTRCYNTNYRFYHRHGGRGISVCERWHTFENFFADMGERPSPDHSLDRKDNDGNYEPGNCRWATRVEQAQNSRNVLNSRGLSSRRPRTSPPPAPAAPSPPAPSSAPR